MAISGGHAPSSAVVGVTISLTTLAGVAAIARLYTRIKIVRKAGPDDICICVALALTTALTVTMCEQVNYGMGRHAYTLTDNDVYMSLRWFWASVWIYYLALCFTKLSILLQYLRVFPYNRFRTACFILMGVVIVYSCCTFFASIFACTPVAYFWNKSLNGTCLNETAIWFANASINIVTDIATAVLPLPVLNTLNIPKRQKYGLMAVFGLGGFTCIISILRLQSLYVVSRTKDISWYNPLAAIWSSTEVNVAILCSCLPTLKGLVSRFFPDLFTSTYTFSTRNSMPLSAGNARCRLSPPHAENEAPEMSTEVKRGSRVETHAMDERDSPDIVEPRAMDDISFQSRNMQTFLELEEGRDDDDATTTKSDSIVYLAPMPRSYQPL